ncbi:hypothetical protein ACFOLF_06220 [Paenibacillus sepulcri]|uniref:hypothetical protein n=1 Tax=Paenibacillus sepulcri TaxID=359917 RepID=UPI00361BFB09
MTNNVLELVRELRVDALYGKKKHYNAAERKQKYHTYIGISSLVANILAGSILFAFFSNEWSNWGKMDRGASIFNYCSIYCHSNFFQFSEAS